ncbi:hypothetical protein EV192_1011179 [Actinocrispum wychmicini]|uniref:Uncharacterized protein n=1 Tax=Actinocrispum wychmicini TaxID=1213861 RepID=A0A4R2K129_9PSEU|nr:hypothetical protein EV192_1011179 [Actinocrispum wychmicini]
MLLAALAVLLAGNIGITELVIGVAILVVAAVIVTVATKPKAAPGYPNQQWQQGPPPGYGPPPQPPGYGPPPGWQGGPPRH